MTPGMWADAFKALEAQLVCPCGAMNSPNFATNPIRLDERGSAACSQCGHGGAVQEFIPKYLKEK